MPADSALSASTFDSETAETPPKGPQRKRQKRSDQEIEKFYDETSARILQERSDFLLPQVVGLVIQEKWVNLRPEYQRRLRWDDSKKSMLIESLLMNVPIPPIFLFETELNRYEVMDGQQRLVSIIDFYQNKLRLKGLEVWGDLNGRTYEECPTHIRRGLDRRRISAVVLLAESKSQTAEFPIDIRHEVFERLNTGGTALNPQELRNCIYTGSFNQLIIDLARDPMFTDMWNIPRHNANPNSPASEKLQQDRLYRTMGDCQIVLRFFAFRDFKYVSGSVRSMLDRCMERLRTCSPTDIEKMRSDFISRLRLARSIMGKSAFVLPTEDGTHSRPLFDAVMVALDHLWAHRTALSKNKNAIRRDLAPLIQKPAIYRIIVGKPNTADAVKKRIRIVEAFLKSHI